MKASVVAISYFLPKSPTENPPCSAVSAMLRRRCSLATRSALECAYSVLAEAQQDPSQINVVHGTRFGEISALQELLNSLAVSEPLSPTAFSNSVHHTPLSYFSLNSHNCKIGRTVSAGKATFAMTLLESMLLVNSSQQRVLMMVSDEFWPKEFEPYYHMGSVEGAMALLLDIPTPGAKISLAYTPGARGMSEESPSCIWERISVGSSEWVTPVGCGEIVWKT